MNAKPRPPRAQLRHLWRPALLACAALAGACDDPFKPKAQFANLNQPFVVHAMSGTPLVYASALSLPARSVTRVDGSFAFDVAFDLDANGDVVLLPVSVVGTNPSGARRVGILRPGKSYDTVEEAPLSGYTFDSVTVLKRGEAAVIQAHEAFCGLSFTPYLNAKIVVDSIDATARTLTGRVLINLNCGFRSLTAGVPEF